MVSPAQWSSTGQPKAPTTHLVARLAGGQGKQWGNKSDFTFKGSKDLGGNGGRGLLPERRGLKKSLRTWRSFDYTYLRLQTVLMRIYYMGL